MTVLIDPLLTGNPKAAASADELEADAILVSHGHGDHVGDTASIAKRTGATVVAITELAGELSEDGLENVRDPNLGGTVSFDWGTVKLVSRLAHLDDAEGDRQHARGPDRDVRRRDHLPLGDTALFGDMELIGRRHEIDVALMCIGGHYTMDRHDAVEAARLIGARQVIPCHYNTFPPIVTDAQAFKSDVEAAGAGEVVVLDPGARHTL